MTTLLIVFALIVGTQTVPYLRIWNGENHATEHLQVSDDTNVGAARFYARTSTGLNWGAAMAAHGEGTGQAVGLFSYGETEGSGTAWGANIFAATYTAAPAVGIEAAGINFSSLPAPVYGIEIFNSGLAATRAALAIETGMSAPLGKPDYGIWIVGPSDGNPNTPASKAGIFLDHIDSGVALQIEQGDKMMLSHDGNAYLYYDGSRIKFVRNGVVRGSW